MKTADQTPHLHACQLRASIQAAGDQPLPRRDVLITWLDGFIQRSARADYVLGVSEDGDLVAVDKFLRAQHVPTSAAN